MRTHPATREHNHGKQSVMLFVLLIVISCLLLLQVGAESIRLSQADIEKLGQKYGQRAKLRLQSWQALLTDLADKDEQEKLTEVNRFFNQVRFIDDIKHWKKKITGPRRSNF